MGRRDASAHRRLAKFTLIEEFDNQSALDAHNTYDHFLTYAPILGANAAVTITKLTPI